ncbi:aldehyde dehydrogenase family protein [Asticcacaulis sp.]|uniref:aldehyde dehydrogenase family protein n=1 Tax=Asticcacaulis sp. TaxID=1872648 RepID=UPI002C899D40|nr:aldehyde dehydrogenase family protein [Asticcacaulis sp.]HTM82847.1 aldehyde dehydrogenase family protein [Asticcacaulis sp.]
MYDSKNDTLFQKAVEFVRTKGALPARYENFIGGAWIAPVDGAYFTDHSPINAQPLAQFAQSTAQDVETALDAAYRAKAAWAKISPAERAKMLNRIADRMEENLELLAIAETLDNGKPIRETRGADVPLAIDHFRYFAGCIRAEEGRISTIDDQTIAYHFQEPLGVVGQIIPWNFPLLMAAWKLAPALAAGNCTVIKPASNTPLSLLILAGLTIDILPPGVLNVVTGPGGTVGKAIAANPRISKVSFTGETTTGRQIMQYASEHLIPQTMELGGKSPNIFMADIMDSDDAFFNKALEGFALFAFNKGEVCTCPSRALIQESIFDKFLERAIKRVENIKVGNPLDPETQMGAQASEEQLHKILGYIDIGNQEGATCLTGGMAAKPGGDLDNGYFVKPTVFVGDNSMRIFQEEIFGPVLSVAPFKTIEDAIRIGNDTIYGLGAGVWSRNGNAAYRIGREIEAGRVWTNCYHVYPAHAAFGGYKASGFGRENHRMMLEHYQQTKNLLVSYGEDAQGLF